jgi:hypothetical protein
MDDVPQAPDYHSQESILRHARADHAGTRSCTREIAQQQRETLGAGVFFRKCAIRHLISDEVIDEDVFERLLTFSNVVATAIRVHLRAMHCSSHQNHDGAYCIVRNKTAVPFMMSLECWQAT